MSNIAYVDDNCECLALMKMAFKAVGLEIDTFDGPVSFCHAGREYPLVICDYYMPHINGQDFISLLKTKYPKTKTILYSGVLEDIEQLDLNIDTFLSKPTEFEHLLKATKYLLYEYQQENKKRA